ncbi:MAG: THUMP-like domain-containing protein [Alcanivorax sp.]
MDWEYLLKPEVQGFIDLHEADDVKALALKKAPDVNWPYPLVLDQIKTRQKAKTKSPDLYDTDGFIFPPHDLYEQASSQACATYKASLVGGGSFVDLTSGAGADSLAFAKRYTVGLCTDVDPVASSILKHNASVMAGNLIVLNVDCADFLEGCEILDFAFIDPKRRENGRKGLFDLASCAPNILDLLPLLKRKVKKVMMKTSPFLDIEKGIEQLGAVTQVHVVQWRGECKEVLYILDFEAGHGDEFGSNDVEIVAVNLDDHGHPVHRFSYHLSEEKNTDIECAMPMGYIYEPGPAFQKAGGYKMMAVQYGVKKIHPNSHIYTSEKPCENFPGKVYRVEDVLAVKAKNLPVKKADLVVRNFPSSVDALRRKLKLKDGGVHRIFATTIADGQKKLILCAKD